MHVKLLYSITEPYLKPKVVRTCLYQITRVIDIVKHIAGGRFYRQKTLCIDSVLYSTRNLQESIESTIARVIHHISACGYEIAISSRNAQ